MASALRTTVTLDPDVEALIRRVMRERGWSFKEAVNAAIRAGLGLARHDDPPRTPTFAMGFDPAIAWDKALAIAGDLEDDELIRRIATRT